jgi:hypothetical protein
MKNNKISPYYREAFLEMLKIEVSMDKRWEKEQKPRKRTIRNILKGKPLLFPRKVVPKKEKKGLLNEPTPGYAKNNLSIRKEIWEKKI